MAKDNYMLNMLHKIEHDYQSICNCPLYDMNYIKLRKYVNANVSDKITEKRFNPNLIYKMQSLMQQGYNVHQTSAKLNLNYRTAKEITNLYNLLDNHFESNYNGIILKGKRVIDLYNAMVDEQNYPKINKPFANLKYKMASASGIFQNNIKIKHVYNISNYDLDMVRIMAKTCESEHNRELDKQKQKFKQQNYRKRHKN